MTGKRELQKKTTYCSSRMEGGDYISYSSTTENSHSLSEMWISRQSHARCWFTQSAGDQRKCHTVNERSIVNTVRVEQLIYLEANQNQFSLYTRRGASHGRHPFLCRLRDIRWVGLIQFCSIWRATVNSIDILWDFTSAFEFISFVERLFAWWSFCLTFTHSAIIISGFLFQCLKHVFAWVKRKSILKRISRLWRVTKTKTLIKLPLIPHKHRPGQNHSHILYYVRIHVKYEAENELSLWSLTEILSRF